MIIDLRINVPSKHSAVPMSAIRDLVLTSLSGLARGEKHGMGMIAGAGVAWRCTKHETIEPEAACANRDVETHRLMADLHELGAHDNMTVADALELSLRQSGMFQHVLVIGWHNDGEFICRSSHMSKAETNWLLDAAKYWAIFNDDRMRVEVKKDTA